MADENKIRELSVCMLAVRENLVTSPFMNILIEDAEKLEYLTGENQWTKNAAEGKSFGATETAFGVAKKEPIGRFNIVFYIPQTRQFVNLNHGRGKGTEASPA
ncbi:MAG: hypothetical protein ABSA45_04815 [Verrucomicrobiota bacterium]